MHVNSISVKFDKILIIFSVAVTLRIISFLLVGRKTNCLLARRRLLLLQLLLLLPKLTGRQLIQSSTLPNGILLSKDHIQYLLALLTLNPRPSPIPIHPHYNHSPIEQPLTIQLSRKLQMIKIITVTFHFRPQFQFSSGVVNSGDQGMHPRSSSPSQ